MSVESLNSSQVPNISVTQSSPQKVGLTSESNAENKFDKQNELASSQNVVPDKETLEVAVSKLNDFMQNSPQRNLSFSVDETSKELVVVVTDKLTDEVIRQMPTEEALAVAKQIESMLGLILNDKA